MNTQSKQSTVDTVAPDYDISFTHTETGRLQRARVWNYMEKLLGKGTHDILEVNCGTGEDALWFAQRHHHVIATDTSGGMIAVAETKRIIQNVDNAHFYQMDCFKLHYKLRPTKYDIIFSGFGGLDSMNTAELEHLSQDFANLMNPEGKLTIVMQGKYCLWEMLYYSFKVKLLKAFKRWDNEGVITNVGTETITNWYYSKSDLKEIFDMHFELLDAKPIAFAVPPVYLETFNNKRKKLLRFLYKLDNVFTRIGFLSGFSDHFILTFRLRKHI